MSTTAFTVKRSNWLHGEGGEKSFLLRPADGKQCCLGFLGQACGYTSKQLSGRVVPMSVVAQDKNLWPEGLLTRTFGWEHTQLTRDLMSINDEYHLDDAIREADLTQLFANIGITVRFED